MIHWNWKKKVIEILNNFPDFLEKYQNLLLLNLRQILLNILKIQNIETDIFKAVKKNNLRAVKLLIENNIFNYNETNENGTSLLSYSIKRNSDEIYKYLLSFNNNLEFSPISEKPKDYESNMYFACRKGKLTSVQWLIEKENKNKYEKDDEQQTPLHYACAYGHLPIVRYLIEKQKVDIDIKDVNKNRPLHYACESGHLLVAQYLISKGANISAKDVDLMYKASVGGLLPIVQYIIKKGASAEANDENGECAIHYACKYGRLQVVQYLIEKQKIDIDARGMEGKTPLIYACQNGHVPVAEYLIFKGANIEATDTFYGMTPLHFAAVYGQTGIAKLLVSNGANVNAIDNHGITPYFRADKDEIKSILLKSI